MTDKKLPPEFVRLLNSLEDPEGPSADEGLQLIKGFLSINDFTLRAAVVDLVEKIAALHTTKH